MSILNIFRSAWTKCAGTPARVAPPVAPKIATAAPSSATAAAAHASNFRSGPSYLQQLHALMSARDDIACAMSRIGVQEQHVEIPNRESTRDLKFCLSPTGVYIFMNGTAFSLPFYGNINPFKQIVDSGGDTYNAILSATSQIKGTNSTVSASQQLAGELNRVWRGYSNRRMDDRMLSNEAHSKEFRLTSEILEALINARCRDGKRREDVVVCVSAHGMFKYTLQIALGKGVKVVSREAANCNSFLDMNNSLHRYATSGRLIFSPYDLEDHPAQKYDIIIWENPNTPMFCGIENLPTDRLLENGADDVIVVIQSDAPHEFIHPMIASLQFDPLLIKKTSTDGKYLATSSIFSFFGITPQLGIFQRKAEV